MSSLVRNIGYFPIAGSSATVWIDLELVKKIKNVEEVLNYLKTIADNLTIDLVLKSSPFGIEIYTGTPGNMNLEYVLYKIAAPANKNFYTAYEAPNMIQSKLMRVLPFLYYEIPRKIIVTLLEEVNPEEHVENLEIYLPYLLGWKGSALLRERPDRYIITYSPKYGLHLINPVTIARLAYSCGITRRILRKGEAPIYIIIPELVEAYREAGGNLTLEELKNHVSNIDIIAIPVIIGEHFYPRNIIEQAETIINQLREKPVETLKRAVATRRSRQVEQYRENNKIITRTVIRHIPLYRLGEETYLLPLPPPTKIIERGDKTIVKYYPPNTGLILKPTRQLTIREILDLI